MSCCAVIESKEWWQGMEPGVMPAGSMPVMMSWLKVLPKLCRVLVGPEPQLVCVARREDLRLIVMMLYGQKQSQ